MTIQNDLPLTQSNPQPVSAASSPTAWASSGAAITTTADRVLVAPQGGALRGYLSGIQLVNSSATATEVVVKDGSTVVWRHYLPAASQPFDVEFVQPLRSSPNTALNFAAATTGANVYVNAGVRRLSGLDDLARRLDRIALRVEGNVERAVKDCAQTVLRSVVEATPVDTGAARSNWSDLDRAFEGLLSARVPGAKGSTADANAVATIEAGAPIIEAFDIRTNREIHITNNAGHIQSLNGGHSKQAPADFVRLAVLDGLTTIRAAKIVDD